MNKKTMFDFSSKKFAAKSYGGSLLVCASLLSLLTIGVSSVKADEKANPSDVTTTVVDKASPEEANPEAVTESTSPVEEKASPVAESPSSQVLASAPLDSSQVMSEAEKQRAIAQMGANQGDVWVWSSENQVPDEKRGPNGGPGQFNAGAVVLGGRPNFDPAADWYYLAYKHDGMTDEQALADFNKERGKWMDEFDPWGVVLEMSDNKATNAWADVRNMQAFVLRQDSNTWDKIMDHPEAVNWVAQFKGNMNTFVKEGENEPIAGGGTAIEVLPKQDRVAHWGSNQVTNIQNPQTIRAVLVSVEARISEKSDPEAKLGIQVGGDWKFTNETIHPAWYPGAGLAGIQRLTKDWARYYFVSITGVQDAIEERGISKEAFLNSVVPLADMVADPGQQGQDSLPNPNKPSQDQNHPAGASLSQLANQKQAEEKAPATGRLASQTLPQTGTRENSLAGLAGLALFILGFAWLRRQKRN
ncbi:LPXTG cell wall anchor domain-containing protein [Streptococcus oricebi]|uniref:Peptidase n=1 Tax=Streptococcus oricebi TaxID=1547447 RepID=A0ABS5B3Y8_9STRE|nr:LPXTG cell wall anchor domain-containing protein [Streptococcus oricebi]MBP2623533.1 peptidase [Streptococcus oricebi]